MSLRGRGQDQPPRDPTDPAGFLTEPLPNTAEERRKADQEHLKRLREIRQRKLLRAGLVGILLIALMIFVLQNAQPVEVNLLFFSGRPLLIWVIVACAVLGGVVGYLLGRPSKTTRLHGEGSGKARKRRT
jgi:uncharacterized integral membrane protein